VEASCQGLYATQHNDAFSMCDSDVFGGVECESQEVSMGKLTAEQKMREYNRGQKAAREGRSRSWSEPWAYPFESDQHYVERREAFNQGYGIIDAKPMSVRRSPP